MQGFTLDFWTLWGITAQGLFFSRFILQWYRSEKDGYISVPHTFWILSLIGAIMILIYAFVRSDLVFMITGILQTGLYSRNLIISNRSNND